MKIEKLKGCVRLGRLGFQGVSGVVFKHMCYIYLLYFYSWDVGADCEGTVSLRHPEFKPS